MKAYVVSHPGGPEALELKTLPDPIPEPGQALILPVLRPVGGRDVAGQAAKPGVVAVDDLLQGFVHGAPHVSVYPYTVDLYSSCGVGGLQGGKVGRFLGCVWLGYRSVSRPRDAGPGRRTARLTPG